MTRVKARYGRKGYQIEAHDHAGTTQSCVAVSAIIQALAGWVHNGHNGAISLDKGEAIIAFSGEGADTAMDLTVIGLLQVQQAAPEDVSVVVEYD